MTERVNLVDAYDNRSVIAKMVSMEERISGAENSIEKTVEDGQTSIDSKVSSGATQINALMSDLKDIKTEATAAASTAETATATANAAVTKAENASATIAADVTTSVNAAADAKGYATSGVLHDGTVVNSAEYFQKLTQTAADSASASADSASASADSASASAASAIQTAAQAASSEINAKTSESNAAASATAAAESAAAVDKGNFVQVPGGVQQAITGMKIFSDGIRVPNRESEATDNDVINFHDLMTPNGDFNNLIHEDGDEDVKGMKFFTQPPQNCVARNRLRSYIKITNTDTCFTHKDCGFLIVQAKLELGVTEGVFTWILKIKVNPDTLEITVTSVKVVSNWINATVSWSVGGDSSISIDRYLYFGTFTAVQTDTRYLITIPDMYLDVTAIRGLGLGYPCITEVGIIWAYGDASTKGNTLTDVIVPCALTTGAYTDISPRSYVRNTASLSPATMIPVQE